MSKVKRILSDAQRKVAASAHRVSSRCEGFKVEWCDRNDNWHYHNFSGVEGHRSWAWYYAKIRAGNPWVAIYERRGDKFKFLEAGGMILPE